MFQEFLLYMLQHYSIRDSMKKKHQIIEALTYQTHYVTLKQDKVWECLLEKVIM